MTCCSFNIVSSCAPTNVREFCTAHHNEGGIRSRDIMSFPLKTVENTCAPPASISLHADAAFMHPKKLTPEGKSHLNGNKNNTLT